LAKEIREYEAKLNLDLYIPIIKVFVGNKNDLNLLDMSEVEGNNHTVGAEKEKFIKEIGDMFVEEERECNPVIFTSCKHNTNIHKVIKFHNKTKRYLNLCSKVLLKMKEQSKIGNQKDKELQVNY